jgi:hypothetical protein
MTLEALKEAYPDLTFEDIGPNHAWEEDKSGYCFVIEALPYRKCARVTVMIDDEPRVAFTGDTVGLRKMLVSWGINRDHLAYVAYELGRAEMSVRDDTTFLQE